MTERSLPKPIAERPKMPPGYLEEARLPWAWVEARLLRVRNYWVATVTAGGRPHCRPVWAVWVDGALYFTTGPSRIRKHLSRAADVSINLESGDECVILEGQAQLETSAERLARVAAAYSGKYTWTMELTEGAFFRVDPSVVFAWISDGSGEDRGVTFTGTATRFTFPRS